MESIIIFGASGHAKVIIDIIEKEGKYKIAGLIDSTLPVGSDVLGYKVLGKDEELNKIIYEYNIKGGIIAIGDNWIRKILRDKILNINSSFRFITAIHPKACIGKNVRIGSGTVIMAGGIVNSDSVIGEHCIINTNSSLDHESYMGDFSSLAPGVVVGGKVKIGNYSAIALGAKVLNNIIIGEHTVVGAGSLILHDVPDKVVVYGVPGKVVRPREIGERYLNNHKNIQNGK